MVSLAEIFNASQHKTRVLILTSHPRIADLLLEILEFSGKESAWFSENRRTENPGSDFVVLQTSDLEKAEAFYPNIVFVSEEINPQNLSGLLKNITGGGVVIYPHSIESEIISSENYFRKLPYTEIVFNTETKTWETEIGSVPLSVFDDFFIKNLQGIQLLAQQFGILDDDFFEPVINFH